MKKILATILCLAIVGSSYFTYRLWVFAGKVSKAFEYTYAAVDCLIQENGQNESDVDILFKGYKSRQDYADAANKEWPGLYPKDSPLLVRKAYNDQIPECHVFYTHYRCWALDPHDPASLDGCGKHFGLNQQEIDTMKKDPSKIQETMDQWWKRRKEEKK